jgi:acetyl esterase/lipase
MKTETIAKKNLFRGALASLLLATLAANIAVAQDASQPAIAPAHAPLPPIPAPMNVPKPGPTNDDAYAPQPILPGGIVIPLFPPDSHYLNTNRIREAEVYNMDRAVPGRISSIVNIHNPSIEVHLVDGNLNTGAAVILAAGGGHNTLNVGGESADFVPYFFNYGINTIILRNRLRRDGYNPKTDEVYDAQQAIRLVRAHAAQWRIDPNKIGIMGFSAGAELAMPAAIAFDDFDKNNNDPSDPLAGISSRPDFVGVIYPGPSPFAAGRGANPAPAPAIPKNTPPSFITCAGWGDRGHAVWANEYFTAMLNAGVPNVEMHIYARGHHPGDQVGPDEPPSTGGLTDRGFIEYGTWPNRFIDWCRDLGFFQKPGVETQAAKDIENFMKQPQRGAGRRSGGGGQGRGNGGGTNAQAGPVGATPQAAAPANP